MLPVPDAAARLGRSPETVRRWIRSGRLASKKIGTQHFIDESDLAAVEGGTLPVPGFLARTSTGEPMPNVVTALRRSRQGH